MSHYIRKNGSYMPSEARPSREAAGEALRRGKGPLHLLSIIALCAMSACGGKSVGESLGVSRDAPDEYTVVSRPSLAVPPDFNLRPPQPGEAPREPTADEAARSIITGKPQTAPADPAKLELPKVDTAVTPVIAKEAPTPATDAFLKRAGADQSDANIRDELRTDAATPADTSKAKTLYDQVIGADKQEPVVDPKKETERLRTNKDEGKPANTGDVPTVPTKEPSVIDSIFSW